MAPFLDVAAQWPLGLRLAVENPWAVAYQTPETLNSPEGASPSENKTLALKAVQASPQTWVDRWIPCTSERLQRASTVSGWPQHTRPTQRMSQCPIFLSGWKGCCQSRKWIYRLGKICFGFRRSQEWTARGLDSLLTISQQGPCYDLPTNALAANPLIKSQASGSLVPWPIEFTIEASSTCHEPSNCKSLWSVRGFHG